MTNPHLQFHHFGLAVRRPEEARKFVGALGYVLGEPVLDPGQNVHLQLCTHASHPAVEIIWPGPTTAPVAKLTERHTSGIVYHLCYETDDLKSAMAWLKDAGLNAICISPPKPASLFDGRRVSFYNIVGMGLVEILEIN
jgi:methylmalonyl-CoA/ethylmalonyl-CoA epimerase